MCVSVCVCVCVRVRARAGQRQGLCKTTETLAALFSLPAMYSVIRASFAPHLLIM